MIGDVDNYTRLKEQLEDYQGAVTFACDHRQFHTGLQLVKRFEKEGKLQQPELLELADTSIVKLLKMDKTGEVSKWLVFIPDIAHHLAVKKNDGKYKEAFSILCAKNEFEEAFRIARAQNLFMESIKTAKYLKHSHRVAILQLQQATQEILMKNIVESPELLKALKALATDNTNNLIAAKAKLFLAMDCNQTTSATLCQEAYATYEEEQNTVGEIECFHIQKDYIEKLEVLIEKTQLLVCKANNLIFVTNQWPRLGKNTTVVRQIEKFYGLESECKKAIAKSKHYFIPKTQYLWIASSHNKHAQLEYDLDGMVKLHQKEAFRIVNSHIQGYTTNWLENAKAKLQKDFEDSFHFYREIREQGYLKPQQLPSTTYNLNHFVELCTLASQLHEEIGDPVNVLFYLLSPFSQLLIPLTLEDYAKLASSMHLSTPLRAKVETAIKLVKKPNCDRWLEAWRILSILCTHLTAQSGEQTDTLLEIYLAENIVPPNFIWDTILNKNRHYFSYWLHSCKLLESGVTALFAIKISTDNFIQHAASYSTADNMLISIENLVSVLSVHTTTLLFMLSHCYSKKNQRERIIPVPGTFQRFMDDFHLINCHGKSDIGIQIACRETARAMEADGIQMEVSSLLLQFLSILTGKFRANFNPWKIAIQKSQQQTGDTLHCLVLTLTVLGNLALMCDKTLISFLQESYQEMLKHLRLTTTVISVPKSFQNAFRMMQKCKTIQDLFQNVLNELLTDSVGMEVMQLKINTQGEQEQIEFEHCQWEKIPDIPMRLQTVQDTQEPIQIVKQKVPITPPPGYAKACITRRARTATQQQELASRTAQVPRVINLQEHASDTFRLSNWGSSSQPHTAGSTGMINQQELITGDFEPLGVITSEDVSNSIISEQTNTRLVTAPENLLPANVYRPTYTKADTSEHSQAAKPAFKTSFAAAVSLQKPAVTVSGKYGPKTSVNSEGDVSRASTTLKHATTVSGPTSTESVPSQKHFKLPPNIKRVVTLPESATEISLPSSTKPVECVDNPGSQQAIGSQKPLTIASYAGAVTSQRKRSASQLRHVTPVLGHTTAHSRSTETLTVSQQQAQIAGVSNPSTVITSEKHVHDISGVPVSHLGHSGPSVSGPTKVEQLTSLDHKPSTRVTASPKPAVSRPTIPVRVSNMSAPQQAVVSQGAPKPKYAGTETLQDKTVSKPQPRPLSRKASAMSRPEETVNFLQEHVTLDSEPIQAVSIEKHVPGTSGLIHTKSQEYATSGVRSTSVERVPSREYLLQPTDSQITQVQTSLEPTTIQSSALSYAKAVLHTPGPQQRVTPPTPVACAFKLGPTDTEEVISQQKASGALGNTSSYKQTTGISKPQAVVTSKVSEAGIQTEPGASFQLPYTKTESGVSGPS